MLGKVVMQRCHETEEGEIFQVTLEDTVRRFFQKYLKHVEDMSQKVVGGAGSLGEPVKDRQLNNALKQVIQEQYVGALCAFSTM